MSEITSPTIPTTAPEGTPALPEGGDVKFFDAKTGVYNWEAHGREAAFKAHQAMKKVASPAPGDGGGDQTPEQVALEALAATAPKDPKDPAAAQKALSGIDFAALTNEVVTTGDLSEASLKLLTDAGIPKEVVESYVAGQKRAAEAVVRDMNDHAGGKEALDALLTWASKSLDQKEIDGFNEMLRGPQWKIAIDVLKGRHAATTRDPLIPGGSGGGGKVVVPFASREERTLAYNEKQPGDPRGRTRYEVDPSYRREWDARVMAGTRR